MGFIQRFFSQIFYPEADTPEINFGKYNDRFKKPEQLENWKKAISFYKQGDYLQSVENFLEYIKNPFQENLKIEKFEGKIVFSFYQGSKIIYGSFDNETVTAYADVVKFTDIDAEVLEILLSENYNLKFSKFVKTENTFRIQMKMLLKNAHPISLYMALRELAITADGIDDILVHDFNSLQPINIHHIKPLPELEKQVKIKYLKKWISNTLKKISKLNKTDFTGGIAFLLLDLNYKIFYLLSPEGVLLEELKKNQKIYNEKNLTLLEKINLLISNFEKLAQEPESEIEKSLYSVKATFPVAPPTDTKKIIDFARKEIDKIHWYRENGHHCISQAICEYVIGFCEFNFALEPIVKDLFAIFWQVLNYKYFDELGFKNRLVIKDKINYFAINHKIQQINLKAKEFYPNFYFNAKHLNIINFYDFASSFVYEFINSGLYEK